MTDETPKVWRMKAKGDHFDEMEFVEAKEYDAIIAERDTLAREVPQERLRTANMEKERDELREQCNKLAAVLEKIVKCDYRGNMPMEQSIARKALAAFKDNK